MLLLVVLFVAAYAAADEDQVKDLEGAEGKKHRYTGSYGYGGMIFAPTFLFLISYYTL